jgi:hypothetical protein
MLNELHLLVFTATTAIWYISYLWHNNKLTYVSFRYRCNFTSVTSFFFVTIIAVYLKETKSACTQKKIVLSNSILSIARNARYVRAREKFAFIMLQSFKSLTRKFDVSDVTHKCFLLTYNDGNFSCQKY